MANIGAGLATTDLELHRLVAEAAGSSQEPGLEPPRPGDLPGIVVDPASAGRILGWWPVTALSDGLAAAVQWHRNQGRDGTRQATRRLTLPHAFLTIALGHWDSRGCPR